MFLLYLNSTSVSKFMEGTAGNSHSKSVFSDGTAIRTKRKNKGPACACLWLFFGQLCILGCEAKSRRTVDNSLIFKIPIFPITSYLLKNSRPRERMNSKSIFFERRHGGKCTFKNVRSARAGWFRGGRTEFHYGSVPSVMQLFFFVHERHGEIFWKMVNSDRTCTRGLLIPHRCGE